MLDLFGIPDQARPIAVIFGNGGSTRQFHKLGLWRERHNTMLPSSVQLGV